MEGNMEYKVCDGSIWNDALLDQVKTMWHDGISAGKIAAALGPHFTSNMVVGQVHRRKFRRSPEICAAVLMQRHQQRQRRIEYVQRVRRLQALKIQSQRNGKVAAQGQHASLTGRSDAPIPSIGPSRQFPPVKLIDLMEYHCRWLHDDGMYCGALRTRGAYCAQHADIAYQPAYG